MKTLSKILMIPALTLGLLGYSNMVKNEENLFQKRNLLIKITTSSIVIINLDSDGDGYEDIRYYCKGLAWNGGNLTGYLELYASCKDKNKNRIFEPEELEILVPLEELKLNKKDKPDAPAYKIQF